GRAADWLDEIVADHPGRAAEDRIDEPRHIEPVGALSVGIGEDQGPDRARWLEHRRCRAIDCSSLAEAGAWDRGNGSLAITGRLCRRCCSSGITDLAA